MVKKNKIYGYIAIIISVILWGASFVWTKELILSNFPVFTIVTLRLVIASIVLLAIFLPRKQIDPIPKKDIPLFILLSLLEPFLYFIGENSSLKYISASFAGIVIALIPIVTAFTICIFNKTKLSFELIIGTLISVFGIWIISSFAFTEPLDIRGVLLLGFAIFIAGFYNLILQRLLDKGFGPVTITFWQNIIAICMYLPCLLIMDLSHYSEVIVTYKSIGALVCLGVLCSAIAYVCYSFSASIITVSHVTVFTNISPIITVFLAFFIGQEPISLQKILGIITVIIGVIISQTNIIKHLKNKSLRQ